MFKRSISAILKSNFRSTAVLVKPEESTGAHQTWRTQVTQVQIFAPGVGGFLDDGCGLLDLLMVKIRETYMAAVPVGDTKPQYWAHCFPERFQEMHQSIASNMYWIHHGVFYVLYYIICIVLYVLYELYMYFYLYEITECARMDGLKSLSCSNNETKLQMSNVLLFSPGRPRFTRRARSSGR